MLGDVSWHLSGNQASLRCGALRGSIDALTPTHGIHDVSFNDRQLPGGRFLSVAVNVPRPDTLVDVYQRGADLIARYAQTDERPFAVLVYWRAGLIATGEVNHPHVDLIVSVETSLLDSRPRLDAQTSLPIPAGNIAFNKDLHYCRFRLADGLVSYIEAAHPDDALTASLSYADEARLMTPLFGQPLEKGVILRSRLRGVFLPQTADEAIAERVVRDFAAAPPPLTT